jgi:nucleoid DNA-binding protein
MANGNGKKAMNKSQLTATLAEQTGLTKAQVNGVLAALGEIVQKELGKKGPGQFTIPGLLKLTVTKKPATKAREGVNPFTGEKIQIAAKPARNVVRARVLKQLKDAV